MQNQNQNPFVLPGLGQTGEMATNPLMASMEMMRKAWQGLAGAGGFEGNLGVPMSVEDLDRRISDLRAVENWLRLNLSMLTSTIQGLEVQRATISTLKTFMTGAEAAAPSAFEALWGKSASGQTWPDTAKVNQPNGGQAAPRRDEPAVASAPDAGASQSEDAPQADASAVPGLPPAVAAQALEASQSWWNMVQQQFDSLAAATAASLQGAEAATPGGGAASESTMGKAGGPARKAAAKTAAASKTARKAPARKSTAARKRTGKQAAQD